MTGSTRVNGSAKGVGGDARPVPRRICEMAHLALIIIYFMPLSDHVG